MDNIPPPFTVDANLLLQWIRQQKAEMEEAQENANGIRDTMEILCLLSHALKEQKAEEAGAC